MRHAMRATDWEHGATLLLIGLAVIIWVWALVILYAVRSMGCELGWDRMMVGPVAIHRAVLIVLWIAHVVAIGILLAWLWYQLRRLWRSSPRHMRFLLAAGVGSTAVALASMLWTGAPIVGLSLCF